MINVDSVMKMIAEIQTCCDKMISLRKTIDSSYTEEVNSIEVDANAAICQMKGSLNNFEQKNLLSIKEKMRPVVEALRADYGAIFNSIKKDSSYKGKPIEENEKALNKLIEDFNKVVAELNQVDFDALSPKRKVEYESTASQSERFEVLQEGLGATQYTCDSEIPKFERPLPLGELAKQVFIAYKNADACIDAIVDTFEQDFNMGEYEKFVDASSKAWLSERKDRDNTQFGKQLDECFTGEAVQSHHKTFFETLEAIGKASEVDVDTGTLEYKQSITIGTFKLLVENNEERLKYIHLSPVLDHYIGDGYLSAPVILDLVKQGNILLHLLENGDDYSERNANFINQIILQFLLSFPVGRLHLWLVDVDDKMKFKFSMLNNVADGILHGNSIIKNYKGAESAISELKGIMDEITDNKLNQNDVDDIFEFNQKFEALKQDVHLLVLVDYPNGMNKQIVKELKQIMANGNRAGIFTLLVNNMSIKCEDYSFKNEDNNEFISWAVKNALVISGLEDKMFLAQLGADSSFVPKTSINMDIFRRVIDTLKQNKELTKTKPVPMSQMFEASDKDATSSKDAGEVLDIPIGIRGADVQTLKLDASGNGNPHAVVIGGTGSGKSILLHTIILSACYKYSPKDLNFYLIDFKGGREFEFYQANNMIENQLPHIKLTGLTNDVEDGLAILQNLQIELQRRNDLFAEKGVKDIIQYRKMGGDMPRLFVIVDEIQELFEKDEKLGQRAIEILRGLFKLGRAYGISLLWASQNIPRVIGLKDQVLSQIGNKISLKLNNPDEAMDIGIDSKKVRALNRPEKGLGVISDSRLSNDSAEFRVAFAEDDLNERMKLVKTILDKWKGVERSKKPLYIVGNGIDPSPIAEGTVFTEKLSKSNVVSKSYASYSVTFGDNYINGEPFDLNIPVINENKSNLLFVGTDVELLRDMMGYALLSLTREHITNSDFTGNNDKIVYANGEMYNPKDSNDLYNVLKEDFSSVIEDATPTSKFKDAIQTIYKEYRKRVKEADTVGLKGTYAPLFVVAHSIQRYADLFNNNPKLVLKETIENGTSVVAEATTKYDDFFAGPSFSSMSSASNEDKDTVFFVDAVKELVERGGQFGIHFIISIDTTDSLKNISNELKTIKYKVFTKGVSAMTISQILGGSYSSSYNITNSKVVLLVYQETIAKICAYRYDDENDSTWYKKLAKNYLSL